MSKKVSELTKELDISLQELKGYAEKLGIEVGTARSSLEDADAERLARSINMMKGVSDGDGKTGGKPKIKAVPVVHKEGAKAKSPAGKPVIPKKPVPPKDEEPKAAEAEEAVKEEPAAKAPEKAEAEKPAKEAKADVPAAEKPEAPEKPEKKEEPKAEKKEKPEEKPEEEYVNAPGKPMRFKKISDAAT
jgi:translation initiation factor IF-2